MDPTSIEVEVVDLAEMATEEALVHPTNQAMLLTQHREKIEEEVVNNIVEVKAEVNGVKKVDKTMSSRKNTMEKVIKKVIKKDKTFRKR